MAKDHQRRLTDLERDVLQLKAELMVERGLTSTILKHMMSHGWIQSDFADRFHQDTKMPESSGEQVLREMQERRLRQITSILRTADGRS